MSKILPGSEEELHFSICDNIKKMYPDVVFLTDLSGVRLHASIARKVFHLKSSRGIPDLIILEPRGVYHGLLIELKRSDDDLLTKEGNIRKDTHLQEQEKVLEGLEEKGYYASFSCGLEPSIKLIDWYMGLPEFNLLEIAKEAFNLGMSCQIKKQTDLPNTKLVNKILAKRGGLCYADGRN